jgi:hypothetical protein
MFKKKGCISRFNLIAAVFLLYLVSSTLNAQKLNHPLVLDNTNSKKVITGNTVRVLAVMVQFRSDKDTLTSGNGTFDISNKYKDTTVDAPPHDKQYFTSHLKFLQNYYKKVSDGKVNIEFFIPDKVYTLPDSMRKYSPPKGSDYSKLADLAVDSWTLVDKESPEIDFSQYDCFFIFHAGSGKDIDLASIYGSDPTPYDLPSLTFNLTSFKKYLGSSFDGIPVDGGKVKIQNSSILPESEYRELQSYGVTTLVELSINGLIVSSLAGYLGLPDLFNTDNGGTAIGRFGLMDGQAIFSYNGLFPPEPSAWEKIYLGWVTPITVQNGLNEFNAIAHRTDGVQANSQIYKVPISDKEYFLVECRYRDPGNNGLNIKSEVRGVQKEFHINKDTTMFDQFGTVSLVNGVLTDVDDYDWSLPSGYDYKNNKLNGGILIWHIDENVIESGILTNSINNNIDHRGVDLEEADGAQDIGRTYTDFTAASGSENGTALDFWYNDLSYYSKDSTLRPVYTNSFSPTSNPNSRSYYGANSHISIYDFSLQGPSMTFKVKIGDDAVTLLKGYPIKLDVDNNLQLSNADLKGDNSQQLLVNSKGNLKILDVEGNNLASNDLSSIKNFAVFKEPLKNDQLVVDKIGSTHSLEVYNYTNNLSKVFEQNISSALTDSFFIFTSAYVSSTTSGSNSASRIKVLNKSNGIISHIGYSDNKFYYSSADTIKSSKPIKSIIGIDNASLLGDRYYFSLSDKSIYVYENEAIKLSDNQEIKNLLVGKIGTSWLSDIAFLVYNNTANTLSLNYYPYFGAVFPANTSSNNESKTLFNNVCSNCWSNVSPVVFADIDNDLLSDFVFTFFDKLYAYNIHGTLLDNFPITFKTAASNVRPIIADINGDSRNEIVVASADGNLYAYNEKGKLLDGFPISIGSKPLITPVFFKVKDSIGLAVINSEGYLYAWKLNGKYNPDKIAWSGDYANERMSGSQAETKQILTVKSSEYLPKGRAYNYPNPVYGSSTKIRYYLSDNSNVKIKIFDLSGETVKDFSVTGVGGVDNEVEWDVSRIQSGVYLAQIKADSGSKSSSVVIKIAVIK